MKRYTEEYKDFLYEKLTDTVSNKIGDEYKSMKMGLLELIDDTMKGDNELVNAQNFINDYITDKSDKSIIGLVDNVDVFNFYLKFQANIDEVCNNNKFFDKTPSSSNVFSLYDFIITGTKFATKEVLKMLVKDIF